MHLDVTDLVAFYREPTGAMVRRLLQARIRARWRQVTGEAVLGFGFATPFLRMLKSEAGATLAMMPARQGVLAWPHEGPYVSSLVDDEHLPLPDQCIDRILAVHALEMTDRPAALLREFWRVLTPEGRLLLLVPNRAGLWAQFDSTPFGHGRPFSRSQLRRLLQDAQFEVTDLSRALAVPPLRWALVRNSALTWERIGQSLWPAVAGITVAEATKTVLGGVRPGLAPARAQRLVLRPVAAAAPSARRSPSTARPWERRP